MARVLVTGASGFLGGPAVRQLVALGDEVHGVSSREQPAQPDVRWHRADLLGPGVVGPLLDEVRPTHLLHLAWYVVPGKLITADENFRWVGASLELLRRFRERGGVRAVVCGSAYEYDWRYGYCVESLTPTTPDTVYGSCKAALYGLASAFARQSGLSLGWGRVFFLYGPREHPDRLVASVVRSLLAGRPAKCSHGRQVRDYMHCDDAAGALVALLRSAVEGPVNIASGTPVALRDLILAAARKLNGTPLIELGAIPVRANDAPVVLADVSRLTDSVGWRPAFDLDRGLDDTIEWWRRRERGAGGGGA